MKESKLIQVFVEKKSILIFRFLMCFVVAIFFNNIYEAFKDGEVAYKGETFLSGTFGFYFYVFCELIIAAVFIWLATGGIKEKVDGGVDEDKS